MSTPLQLKPGSRSFDIRAVITAIIVLNLCGFLYVGIRLWSISLGAKRPFAVAYATLESRMETILGAKRDRNPLARGVTVERFAVAGPAGATMCADSLRVDPVERGRYPALRDGGFLADQVQAYNGIRRKQVRLARLGQLDLEEICGSPTPSILLAGDDGPDTLRLSQRVAIENLRVRAPVASTTFGVLGRGSIAGKYSLTSRGAMALLGGRDSLPPTGCQLRAMPPAGLTALQCLERGGPPREVNIFEGGRLGALSIKVIPAKLKLRLDGVLVPPGKEVALPRGTLVDLRLGDSALIEPAVVSRTPGKPLGGVRWINGRLQWVPMLPGLPIYLHDALGAGALLPDSLVAKSGADRFLRLTIDPELTTELNARLNTFVAGNAKVVRSDLRFASVLLFDIATGEVRAVGEVGRARDGLSWLRQPVTVGSAIKPVLAASILSQWPELGSLEVYHGGEDVVNGLGTASFGDAAFEVGHACPKQSWIGLRLFLTCSSNLYAASLTALGMRNAEGRAPDVVPSGMQTGAMRQASSGNRLFVSSLPAGGISEQLFHASTLRAGLDRTFDLTASAELARAQRESRPWDSVAVGFVANGTNPSLTAVNPGSVAEILPSRLDLLPWGQAREPVRGLATYAIGAGENRISLFRLGEAYLRIITDRQVNISMVASPVERSIERMPPMRFAREGWYGQLMGGLTDVFQAGGTGRVVGDAVRQRFNNEVRPLGKTGTLGDSEDRVFAKTLVMGLVPANGFRGTAARCGVMAVVYFRFRNSTNDAAMTFTETQLLPLIQRYRGSLIDCPGKRQ
ncbi:MAG: hypothetical protein ABIZ70_13620 [Gemmatimonadales bacterium]